MFKVLVDTCVWLDVVKDPEQQKVLDVIEELVNENEMQLLVPRTIVDEFSRNKARVIRESTKSLSSVFKRVKDTVDKFGDNKRKKVVMDLLNDIDYKLPNLGEAVIDSAARIEELFSNASVFDTPDVIKIRAAQRAIDKKAPFHREKNSINDAILIETYASYATQKNQKGVRFAFVTHNTKDFSNPNGDERTPHPDFAPYFSKIKSLYFIKLAEAVRKIKPELVNDKMVEDEWIEEPRQLSEIQKVEEELISKLWYDRHQMLRYQVEVGKIQIVDRTEKYKHNPNEIVRDIWEGARKAAKRVEKKYGSSNLGPYDDYEWGMLNGKLSAIRWVMGYEWDFLDT